MSHIVEDFRIEDDDDIFLGIPEDDVDMSGLHYLWENEEQQRVAFEAETNLRASTSQSQKGKRTGKGQSKSKKTQDRLPCPHCRNTYATERTLANHLNSVAFKDLTSLVPDLNQLKAEMKDLAVKALLQCKEALTSGLLAQEVASYSNKIAVFVMQCDATELLDFLSNLMFEVLQVPKKTAFVSALRESVVINTNKLLTNDDILCELKPLFTKAIECEDVSVLYFFISSFIMRLSNKTLIFVSHCMHSSSENSSGAKKRSKDNFTSRKFQRIVHYIAGSVVCGVNRRRRTYPDSIRIRNFSSVLNSSFVEDTDDPSTWCEEEVKQWTSTQNRGGLKFVSKKAFEFFSMLVQVAMNHEEEDGSVYIKKVGTAVVEDFNILSAWDSLVGTALDEDISFEWLIAMVEVICRCVSKGIIKRRINEALQKPTANTALRQKLTRN